MIPSINKSVLVLAVCLLIGACADKSQEPAAQEPETAAEAVTVEAQVSPEQVEAMLPPAPAQTEVAPVVYEPLVPASCDEDKQEFKSVHCMVIKSAPQQEPKQVRSKTLTDEEIIARFKQWDENLQTLETSFNQLSVYDGVEISRSQGNLYYEKKTPMLRLDTLTLDGTVSQTALTDKKNILILDDQKQPITTLSWQEWQSGQPNQALFDFGNYTALIERHNTSVTQRSAVNTVLLLTPKEGEQYLLYLTLNNRDYFPTEIKIVADLMVTTAVLSETRTNTVLDNDLLFGGFNL